MVAMRDDGDFAAYLAARWPFLVRSLVLLGCSPAEAEELARAGLARCYASWERVRRADDVDVHVHRAVLAGWGPRHHPHRGGRGPAAAARGAPAGEQGTTLDRGAGPAGAEQRGPE